MMNESQAIQRLFSLSAADGEFSHREMLIITGLGGRDVFNWAPRGVLLEGLAVRPGRGNRRVYTGWDLAGLYVQGALVRAGVPVSDARELAPKFRLQVASLLAGIESVDAIRWQVERGEMLPALILRRPAGWTPRDAREFCSDSYVAVQAENDDTLTEIWKWLRRLNVRSTIVLDVGALALDYVTSGLRVIRETAEKR